MWKAFLLFVSLTAGVSAAETAPKASDLIRDAVERNPSVQSAKMEWESKTLDRKNRLYGFFPALSFQTSAGVGEMSAYNVNDPFNSQFTFQLQDTLYGPDNNYWTYKEGVLAEQFAEISYRQSRDALIFTLIQKIYTFLNTDFQLGVSRQILQAVESEYRIIQSSYRQGLKSYSDFLRFKGEALSARMDVQNLETLRKQQLVDVQTVLNKQDEISGVRDDLAALGATVPISKSDLLAETLWKRQKELADVNVEVVKARLPWEVDLNLGANYQQSNYLKGLPWLEQKAPWEAFGVVALKWQIFDWGISQRTIQIQRLQQNQAVMSQEELRATALGRVVQLQEDMQRLEGQMPTLGEIVRVQDENLKQQTRDYRNGKATFLDYSNALTSVGQVKKTFRQSELALKQIRAEALSLKGKLYETVISQ